MPAIVFNHGIRREKSEHLVTAKKIKEKYSMENQREKMFGGLQNGWL